MLIELGGIDNTIDEVVDDNYEDIEIPEFKIVSDEDKESLEIAKDLENEIKKAKSSNIASEIDEIIGNAKDVNGTKVITKAFKGIEAKELAEISDRIKDKVSSCVILLGTENGESVNLLAVVTEDNIQKGNKAGDLVREMAQVVDGKGGGRPNMAQAGGKNCAKLNEAIEKGISLVK